MQDVWLEKYRPKYLKDVKGNKEIVDQFVNIVKEGSVPNMILTGPPGCGKTSSVLCIAREMLGENMSKGVIELNASDERGIDVVRNKIKEFAQQKVKLPNNAHKIIILDEADSLTTPAQQAMRMIITDYSDSTRFVFACNDSSRLIEPIQSRCLIVRFSKLKEAEIESKLLEVAKIEGIDYDQDGLAAILFSAEGDMRAAINNLQATHVGAGKVTKENVYKVCDIPDIGSLKAIVLACTQGDKEDAFAKMKKLWDESFTAFDLVNNIGKVIEGANIDIDMQYDFIDAVSDLKVKVLQGLTSFVQLLALLSRLCDIADGFNAKKKSK